MTSCKSVDSTVDGSTESAGFRFIFCEIGNETKRIPQKMKRKNVLPKCGASESKQKT